MVTEDNALAYSLLLKTKKVMMWVYNDAKGEVKDGIKILINIDLWLRKTMI